jgi:predicted nucleotide-binding protein
LVQKYLSSSCTLTPFSPVLLGKGKDDPELKQRARQNVIFELGFFAGSLGRAKVCVIYDPILELPSDLAGVLAVPADLQGAWKMQLAKEMRAAGIPVNAERVMSAH